MMRETAVVHVCESLASGILSVVPPFANETARRGIPTVVVHGARPETPSDVEHVFDPRVRVVPVPGWGDRSPRGLLLGMRRASAMLNGELACFEGGVLHLHSTLAGVVGRTVPARQWRRFYTPQGYAFLNASHHPVMRLLTLGAEVALARRAQTLACSQTEGAIAGRLAGGRRVTVIANGVHVDAPTIADCDGDAFVVASVGRAVYQRRPDLFARMTRLLADLAPASFRWFGDGPERDLLQAAGVAVSGWLPQGEVAPAVARADVLVHFSAFEGLPFSLLEAMALGRAIVASDLPVIREVVDDTAFLVRDAEEGARAVRRLHSDEALRVELAERARDRVRRLFSRSTMVNRTLAAYGLESPDYPTETAVLNAAYAGLGDQSQRTMPKLSSRLDESVPLSRKL
jgi:glycosyltransferase involved in cell wall biosynthesis